MQGLCAHVRRGRRKQGLPSALIASCALESPSCPCPQGALTGLSKGAVIAERGLHEFYFDFYGIKLDVEKAPGCFTYTNFLISITTHGSYEESLAALLPCFWIYQEVGLHIHGNSVAKNPYQKWIDMYSGEEFQSVVKNAIGLTDRIAKDVNDKQLQKMKEAFIKSTQLEWLFWDSAYRMENWQPKKII